MYVRIYLARILQRDSGLNGEAEVVDEDQGDSKHGGADAEDKDDEPEEAADAAPCLPHVGRACNAGVLRGEFVCHYIV